MCTVPYRLYINDARRDGKTDDAGWIHEKAITAPSRIRVSWGVDPIYPDFSISMYEMWVQVNLTELEEDEDPDTWRFHNLGYGADCEFPTAVAHFQADYGLPATGIVDGATRLQLKTAHDAAEPNLKTSEADPLVAS